MQLAQLGLHLLDFATQVGQLVLALVASPVRVYLAALLRRVLGCYFCIARRLACRPAAPASEAAVALHAGDVGGPRVCGQRGQRRRQHVRTASCLDRIISVGIAAVPPDDEGDEGVSVVISSSSRPMASSSDESARRLPPPGATTDDMYASMKFSAASSASTLSASCSSAIARSGGQRHAELRLKLDSRPSPPCVTHVLSCALRSGPPYTNQVARADPHHSPDRRKVQGAGPAGVHRPSRNDESRLLFSQPARS